MNSIAKEIIMPFIKGMTDTKATTILSENLEDRIDIIFEFIDEGKREPVIRQLVGKIVSGIDEKDYEGELTAIFNWVKSNIRYTRDPHNVELFQKAKRILELGLADCDCLSILIGSMVQSIGYPVKLRVIGVSSKEAEHIYPLAGVPPTESDTTLEWVAMDASVDQPIGWQIDENQLQFIEDYEDEN